MINGKPKLVGKIRSCRKGLIYALKLDLNNSILSCYCNGDLSATLDCIPKNVKLYPAAYLGGHPNPMIFTTTFKY